MLLFLGGQSRIPKPAPLLTLSLHASSCTASNSTPHHPPPCPRPLPPPPHEGTVPPYVSLTERRAPEGRSRLTQQQTSSALVSSSFSVTDHWIFADVYGGIQSTLFHWGTAGHFKTQLFCIFVALQPKMAIRSCLVGERHTETEREREKGGWEGGSIL